MANSVSGNFISGEKTVTAAGTAEALGTGLYRAISIIAKVGNVGQVYLGGTDVASTTNDGLDAGESVDLATYSKQYDLANIFIDVGTSGEGVDFYATQ